MTIKAIIISSKTKATRINADKVQLELTAFPIDEENDTEPDSELRLYINNQIFQTIKSDNEWKIKEIVIINDKASEQILLKIEDIIQWVQSKIKCVMIEDTKEKEEKEKKEDIEKEIEPQNTKETTKKEIIKIISKRGRDLSDTKYKEYINDFDIVMAAVNQNWLAIQFASENLKNNFDIVTAAIKQNWLALKHCSNAIKEIPEICIEAIQQNLWAYDYCWMECLGNDKVLETVFNVGVAKKTTWDTLKKIPKHIKDQFTSASCWNWIIYTICKYVRNNKEVLFKTIENTNTLTVRIVIEKYTGGYDKTTIKEIIQLLYKKPVPYYISKEEEITEMIKTLPNNIKGDFEKCLAEYTNESK